MLKILTGGNEKFKKMINMSIQKIEQFGYEPIVYDLGGLEIGKKMEVEPVDFERTENNTIPLGCHFKPTMIKDCLEHVENNSIVVYLDADALLLHLIDELDTNNYDIAITVRKPEEVERFINHEFMGAVNTGVIIFRKTEATMKFIDSWIEETKKCFTDQSSFNNIVRKFIDLTKMNQVVEKDDLKVKLLSTEVYNNYYTDFSMAKIRHYKGNNKRGFLS
ncbi:MAG: putative nucleotide-diphospho-sugar transferase [Methanogenium sp.]|jgi:hypothetical protein